MRLTTIRIAASAALAFGFALSVAAPATAQLFGGNSGGVTIQPPSSGQAPLSGPTSSNYGFPKPVVEQPKSTWTNPLAGAATAVQNAFTVSQPYSTPTDNLRAGDPTSLRTALPTVNANVHLQAARLASGKGHVDEAKRQYEAVLALEPNHVESLISLARIADLREGMNAAAKIYIVALNAHPKRAAIHNDFGMCAARHERLDVSLSAFNEAVRLAPDKVLYRNNFAKALIQAGRHDEALKQLVAAHPPASAHYNFAFLLNENNASSDQVIFHLRQALRIDPTLGNARILFHQVADRERVLQQTRAFNNLRQDSSAAMNGPRVQSIPARTQQLDNHFASPSARGAVGQNSSRRYRQQPNLGQPAPPHQPNARYQPPATQGGARFPNTNQPIRSAPGQAYQPPQGRPAYPSRMPHTGAQAGGSQGRTPYATPYTTPYTASRFPSTPNPQPQVRRDNSMFRQPAQQGPVYLPAAAPGRNWN